MENNSSLNDFRALVERSLRTSTILFVILGIFGCLIGGAMIIGPLINYNPGDAQVLITVLLIGVAIFGGSFALILYAFHQKKNTLGLLFERPHDIQDINIITIKRGNMLVYAMHFIDKNKAKRGVMVPSTGYAEAIRKIYLG